MATVWLDRVGATTSTTSTISPMALGSALSGYRAFPTANDGDTVHYSIKDGTSWETGYGVLGSSGTTLTRNVVRSSSSDALISLSGSAEVYLDLTSAVASRLQVAMASVIPGGRLTLESGVPISTTDQTAKTTIYYTPYIHNVIPLWDGNAWVPTTFAETSLALGTLTSGRPYDVFAYLSSGSLALELLAWTNDTTRATAVTLQDGRYCKSGDKTRLLLGSFYTRSTTTTEDSEEYRYVSNVYNQEPRRLYKDAGSSSHTYASGTVRQYNGGTGDMSLKMMMATSSVVEVSLAIVISNSASGTGSRVTLGWNDTTSYTDAYTSVDVLDVTNPWRLGGAPLIRRATGRNVVYLNEARANGTGNATFDFGRVVGSVMQ